jgi:hypothetical protein
MRVRILSGNLTGQIVDQPQSEAESNIATGFAVAHTEPVVIVVPVTEYEDEPHENVDDHEPEDSEEPRTHRKRR